MGIGPRHQPTNTTNYNVRQVPQCGKWRRGGISATGPALTWRPVVRPPGPAGRPSHPPPPSGPGVPGAERAPRRCAPSASNPVPAGGPCCPLYYNPVGTVPGREATHRGPPKERAPSRITRSGKRGRQRYQTTGTVYLPATTVPLTVVALCPKSGGNRCGGSIPLMGIGPRHRPTNTIEYNTRQIPQCDQ